MSERNRIIKSAVQWLFADNYTAEELLELHLELDGTPEDLFFKELTEQLIERFPEEFSTPEDVGRGN